MSEEVDDFLAHYGVKGMKWGVRRERESTGRSSGSSKPGYSVDPDGRITIRKGHKLQRVHQGGKQSDGSSGTNYFSFTEKDNSIYTQMLGAGAASKIGLIRKLASNTVTSLEAVEELKSPSRKEAFDVLNSTIEEMGKSAGVAPFKNDFSDKKALNWYQTMNANIVMQRDSDLNQRYFENLGKKGYNILLDEADSGYLSELPIVVLDGAKSLKPVSVSSINEDTLQSAKSFLEANDGKTVRKIEDFSKRS